ncbi:MAG TPA: hypothetical protein VFT59_05345 [Candidatus Saccharimonadales bacterium]|nr:hypothetical protein [Candidatus Saccharimonadales bacterium]
MDTYPTPKPAQPESEHEQNLRLAQERLRPLYERLEAQRDPSPLRAVIDECIRRARPETPAELPDTKD